MKKTNVILWVVTILSLGCACFIFIYYQKVMELGEYQFKVNVPKIDPEHKKLLEKAYPQIIQKLPNFYEYYVEDVSSKSGQFRVRLSKLRLLQSGSDEKGRGFIMIDGSVVALFNKDTLLIEIHGEN